VEGSQWFRLGAIIALFLGSIYVLLPTIFQADPNRAKTEEIRADTRVEQEFDTEFGLFIVEGDPVELAEAVKARLEADELQIDGVVVEEDRIVVRRSGAVSDEDIISRIEPGPVVRLHPLTEVDFEQAPESASALAANDAVQDLAGDAPGGAALDLNVTRASGAKVTVDAPFGDAGPLLLVVDDAIRGVVLPDTPTDDAPDDTDAPQATTGTWAGLGGYSSLSQDLAVTPLPGVLSPIESQIDPAPTADATDGTDDTDAGADKAESALPSWLLAILPDTRMPLGLDLQGGVDLTLQVELDEALLSQANRDLTFLEEDGEEKGLTIEKARRNRYEPIIEVRTPDGADAIQGFFGQALPEQYEYIDTTTDDEGSWHRFEMTGTRRDEIRDQAITQVLDVLRKRVAETKVRDPVVVRKGGGRISVQLPGLADTKTAVSAIGRSAVLQFKLVDPDFRIRDLQRILREAELAMVPSAYANEELLNDYLHREGMIPEDRQVLFEYAAEQDEETGDIVRQRSRAYLLVKKEILNGQDVNGAEVGTDPQTQQANVHLEFKPRGSTIFCDFTGEHVDDQFAIILDGEVQSAPSINERICGGRARITMGQQVNAQQEAKSLAVVLRTGSLNAPVSIGSVRQIGPSLGEAAIQAGSIATVAGGLVVLIFMAIWYRGPGLIANVALVLNILLVLAGLSLFGWTLTLPGIAGIALTIGMAVDANIIIYERIREEIKMGQHARKAVEAGFKKAAVAVLDANITTAIAGVVLFSYGNVTIQGFAVTLLLGIGTTLLTSLFVTRSLLEIVTRRATARLRI